MKNSVWLIFGLVILISIIDLFANIVSFIPVIGDLIETASEAGMEALQVVLVGIGLAIAGKDG